jgi:hypothetical protein
MRVRTLSESADHDIERHPLTVKGVEKPLCSKQTEPGFAKRAA